MSEHNEKLVTKETSVEVSSEAAERSLELQKSRETSGELGHDSELSTTRERAHVESIFSVESSAGEHKSAHADGDAPVGRSVQRGGKKEREAGFKQTMKHVQNELAPTERVFSKVIHNPAVEKLSDMSANTVARPNAILAGSLTAFLAVTAVYVIARNYGYQLSGFETIGAFLVGWTCGLIVDYLRIMVTGKTS